LERSKIASYLGFARRAGKLTLGVEAVGAVKKRVYLLVADEAVAKNSRKEIEKLQRKFGCPLLFCPSLSEKVGRSVCMLAAVRDEGFARAILRGSETPKTDQEENITGTDLEDTWHTTTSKN